MIDVNVTILRKKRFEVPELYHAWKECLHATRELTLTNYFVPHLVVQATAVSMPKKPWVNLKGL